MYDIQYKMPPQQRYYSSFIPSGALRPRRPPADVGRAAEVGTAHAQALPLKWRETSGALLALQSALQVWPRAAWGRSGASRGRETFVRRRGGSAW